MINNGVYEFYFVSCMNIIFDDFFMTSCASGELNMMFIQLAQ